MPDLNLPKRVTDPVHKTIKLSELESRIIQTKIFQRLRNVKQLGLAHYVYPGTDFSRFSHSLGVCHITGIILNELNRKNPAQLSPEETQKYRLAAIFHDIGHYPFSHAMEDAIGNFYKKTMYEPIDSGSEKDKGEIETKPFYPHEVLGKRILVLDPEINSLLKDNGFDPEEIASIFRREGRHKFQNLISSDLDADRIDFLLRTSRHTGLPFGNVDIDYLITQMQVDKNDKLCLSKKAVRAADHFLLCRHFDRPQVAYHKTVVALELALKDIIQALLERKIIDCSKDELKKKLERQEWSYFDDFHILSKIRELKEKPVGDTLKLKIDSILERNPPKLVGESEEFLDRDNQNIEDAVGLVKAEIPELSKKFNIEKDRVYLWNRTKNPITAFGSHLPASHLDKQNLEDLDKIEQLIKISSDNGSDSRPITEIKGSLMSVIAMKKFTSIRLYILFKEDELSKRNEIQDYLKDKLRVFNNESS